MSTIYDGAFVLSAAAAQQPLTLPRILYENLLRDLDPEAFVATSQVAGSPPDVVRNADTATYWQGDALPATLTVIFSTTVRVDAVGIAGHTIGSSGASIVIETRPDNESAWAPFAQEVLPNNNAPLLFLDDELDVKQLRATVTGVGLVPRIAAIYAGRALVMPRPPEAGYRPLNLSRRTKRRQTMSRGGQFLGQEVQRMGMSTELSFKLLDASWYRDTFEPFVQAAGEFPYFFAWNPQVRPREVGFVWTPSDFSPPQEAIDLVSVNFPIEGIGDK